MADPTFFRTLLLQAPIIGPGGRVSMEWYRMFVDLLSLLRGDSKGASLMWGEGNPEGAVTANVGTVFLRTDGGVGSTMYVKESGVSNTGWAAK